MRFLSASPEDINRVGRRGEARVYEMLSQAFGDSDRWYALYGQVVYQLTQAHNLGRRQPVDPDIRPKRELDFIVFDRERGFLVIEVKGGVVRLEGGEWEMRDPDTRQWEGCRDPIEQARTAELNLMNRIVHQLAPVRFQQDMIWHGAAIMLPFSDMNGVKLPLNWHADLVADNRITTTAQVERWIENVFQHFQGQFPTRRGNAVAEHVEHVTNNCIALKFSTECGLPRLMRQLLEHDGKDLLAKDPLNDWVRERLGRRTLLARGGAGTGKTQVAAIRIAHKLHGNTTDRALYLCYNELLAASVHERLAPRFDERVVALSFHTFCKNWILRAGLKWEVPTDPTERDTFYRDGVPLLMLDAIKKRPPSDSEKFDMVAFDEAQDFNMNWIDCLKEFMRPDAVEWALYDPTQFLFGNLVLGPQQPDVERQGMLKMRVALQQRFGDEDVLLCAYRLSRLIFEFIKNKEFDVGNGNKVRPFDDIDCDQFALEGCDPIEERVPKANAVEAIHNAILNAIDNLGFSPQSILVQAATTVGNPEHPLHSVDETPVESWDIAGRYKLRPITDKDAGNGDTIAMATPQKFKGCERMCTIVLRTPAMDGKKFFTAITRARLHVHVIEVF